MSIDPGAFLLGCLAGAGLTLLLTLTAAGLSVWRQGWREGAELSGEEFERNRKRES